MPAGQYYVMGDNRTDSEDSRYFGPISRKLIVGKMAFVVWPLDDTGWMVVLSLGAAAVVLLLVVAAMTGRRERSVSPTPVRGPPLSDATW